MWFVGRFLFFFTHNMTLNQKHNRSWNSKKPLQWQKKTLKAISFSLFLTTHVIVTFLYTVQFVTFFFSCPEHHIPLRVIKFSHIFFFFFIPYRDKCTGCVIRMIQSTLTVAFIAELGWLYMQACPWRMLCIFIFFFYIYPDQWWSHGNNGNKTPNLFDMKGDD